MKVTLAGKPLYADTWEVSWSMTPGVSADRTSVIVPAYRRDEFDSLVGTTVALVIDNEDGASRLEVRNLTVLTVDTLQHGPNQVVSYTLADCRWRWGLDTRSRVSGRFNHLLRLNDGDLAKAGFQPDVAGQDAGAVRGGIARVRKPGGPVSDFEDADIVGQHQTLPKFAYRRLTLNGDTGQPWTAYQLLRGILNGYSVPAGGPPPGQPGSDARRSTPAGTGVLRVPGILLPADGPATPEMQLFRGDPDNKYPISRLSFHAHPAPVVLAELCRLARVRLYVTLDGKVRIIPTDVRADPTPSLPPASQSWEQSQRLWMTQNQAHRPRKVRVLFPIERAVRFHAQQAGVSGASSQTTVPVGAVADRPTWLRNVVRLPVPLTLQIDSQPSREYPAGFYAPIESVCRYLSIDVAWLDKYAYTSFGPLLPYAAFVLGGLPPARVPSTTQRLLEAVHGAHRTLFQLDQQWIERIIDLRAETPVVLDPLSGKRAFSPVWRDHTLLRTIRLDVNPKAETALSDNLLFEKVKYARKGTDGEPAADATPGPFLCVVEDAELGIIRFDPASDPFDRIASLIPGIVAGEIYRIPAQGAAAGPNAKLEPDYGCATELTILTMDPNTSAQFHAVEVTGRQLGLRQAALLDSVDLPVADETARFDADGKLLNRVALDVRARAEAMVYYQSWMDRLTGVAVFAGLHAQTVPFGAVASVRFHKAPDGVLTTTVDCREPLPVQSVEHGMLGDRAMRNLLHQRLKLLPPQS